MTLRTLLLTGAAVLLPSLAPVWLAQAVTPEQESRFSPPAETLMLTRTVIRELSDGNQIKVTRHYAVQFAPDGSGFKLDGKLIDVSVDVPRLLSSLAEVERRRDDKGMFPVHVNSAGAIEAGIGGGPVDRQSRGEMAALANAELTKTGMPQENLLLGSRFVSQVLQAQPGSPWPVDLFRVRPGEHYQSRVVALAGGKEGRVEVVTKVDMLLPCGLPQTIERTVVTLLSGSRRVSREVWTFRSAAPE